MSVTLIPAHVKREQLANSAQKSVDALVCVKQELSKQIEETNKLPFKVTRSKSCDVYDKISEYQFQRDNLSELKSWLGDFGYHLIMNWHDTGNNDILTDVIISYN